MAKSLPVHAGDTRDKGSIPDTSWGVRERAHVCVCMCATLAWGSTCAQVYLVPRLVCTIAHWGVSVFESI